MQKINIAIIAHDRMKKSLVNWLENNLSAFSHCHIYATGTTASVLTKVLPKEQKITPLKSGPLGGDQQIGSMVADRKLDVLFFFQDAMAQQAHDSDIKALVRLATLYEIPIACNRATADFLISSPYFKDIKTAPENKDWANAIQDYKDRNLSF